MDPAKSALPPRRGFPVYALVIVVVIIIVAAVAIQTARQRAGRASWGAAGLTPASAAPRCLWPSDTAYVAGRVDAYPGVPGLTDACFSQRVGAPGHPAPAADVARVLGSGAVRAACGGGPLWYQGAGTYACRPRREASRRDGFAWQPTPSSRENYDQRYRRRLHRDGFIGGAFPCCDERVSCEHLEWPAGAECHDDGFAKKRETFSPDMPGTCSRRRSPAAAYELAALRVAAGQ